MRESPGCSDLPDCAPGDLHLPDCRGWCSPPGWDPARRRPSHLGECVCRAGAGGSTPCLVQGLLLSYWSWVLGLLLSAPELLGEHFTWVVLPCLMVGAVTPHLSPGALWKCCPRNGMEGGDRAALPQPGVPLEPGGQLGLGQGRGGAPWGTVGLQGHLLEQEELPRGAVEQCRGTSALHPELSRPVRADLTALTSCLCLLVLAALLGSLSRALACCSEGILQTLLLVVGFWPSCCGKSTCYHSAGVSKH